MSEVIELTVNGMTCGGCENSVKRVLMQTAGVEAVAASHAASVVGVTFDPAKVTPAVLREKIWRRSDTRSNAVDDARAALLVSHRVAQGFRPSRKHLDRAHVVREALDHVTAAGKLSHLTTWVALTTAACAAPAAASFAIEAPARCAAEDA